jgi:hypothetical protein
MVVCGALVVAPDATVFAPQELAHRPVALDYGNGTAYAGLLMLEGAMPREAISTIAAPVNPAVRFDRLLAGDFAATVLQEPWITIAEKAGCRIVSTTFFHGTWVAAPGLEAAAYAAFLRASARAVRRIRADKRRYLGYFIEHGRETAETAGIAGHPAVRGLGPDDFDPARIQLALPGPIPIDQARWGWEWMSGWGLLEGDFDLAAQIDVGLQGEAHAQAGLAR